MVYMNIEEILIDESDKRFAIFKEIYPEILECKWNGIIRWHLIIIDIDPTKCIFKRGYSSDEPIDLCFAEIYNSILKKEYHKILLLVTYYNHIPKKALIEKLNKTFYLPNHFSSDFFNGKDNYYIAFNEQLEVLYRTLTGVSPWEAIEFRRDINKKNQKALQKAKEIKVSEQFNLYELICTKSFYDAGPFFLAANFFGATLLIKIEKKCGYN